MSKIASNTYQGTYTEEEITQLVRSQYQHFPYPTIKPLEQYLESDKMPLSPGCPVEMAILGKINFKDRNRILVAGAGTGDCTVHLAWYAKHQGLKDGAIKIVHLDQSQASIDIAMQRAEQLGVKQNIEFKLGNIMTLEQDDSTKYHHIQCCGVLHHLPSPSKGLQVLHNMLVEDGTISLMVYGTKGRAGVYEVQQMVKSLSPKIDNPSQVTNEMHQQRLAIAKDIVRNLPATHPLATNQILNYRSASDTEFYDIFCNAKDASYTVNDLYELCQNAGFKTIDMIDTPDLDQFCKITSFSPEIKATIAKLPKQEYEALVEMLLCSKNKHVLYASKSQEASEFKFDLDKYCLISYGILQQMQNNTQAKGKITLNKSHIRINLDLPSVNSQYFFNVIDNKKTGRQIIAELIAQWGDYLNADLLEADLKHLMHQMHLNHIGGMSDYPIGA